MKKINIFKIIILVLCFIALIGLFLPYEKSIGEYRQSLKDNPTTMNIEEVNFKNKDVIPPTNNFSFPNPFEDNK